LRSITPASRSGEDRGWSAPRHNHWQDGSMMGYHFRRATFAQLRASDEV
jgi:hypothetical protein